MWRCDTNGRLSLFHSWTEMTIYLCDSQQLINDVRVFTEAKQRQLDAARTVSERTLARQDFIKSIPKLKKLENGETLVREGYKLPTPTHYGRNVAPEAAGPITIGQNLNPPATAVSY
jgi:hypothetical protein